MKLTIKEINKKQYDDYTSIPFIVEVTSEYKLQKINNGLGGILFKEEKVNPYRIDLTKEENPYEWEKEFDLSNWGMFIVYDDDYPVAGATLVYDTENVRMLGKRKDIVVLWDIRVCPEYKGKGIGKMMFPHLIEWAKKRNCKQIKIETQNTNIPGNKFYASIGAKLGEINEYAYIENKNEAMLIWYLDI